MDNERVAVEARAFIGRFLPPGAASGHSLLYGSGEGRAPGFVPSEEALHRCLQEYGQLVVVAAREDTFLLLDFEVMEASELTIAYLSRVREAGQPVPRHAALAELIRKNEPALRVFVERTHGSGHDALKRLTAVARILEAAGET